MPHTRIDTRIRTYARDNRILTTAGEKEMWKYLQSFRPYGARFRRQAPIGNYIADFAWLSARIVVEVDGATHKLSNTIERDRRKDAFLRREGFRIFRVSDDEVIANSPAAFVELEAAICRHLTTPPPTPPHKGEGCSSASPSPSRERNSNASPSPLWGGVGEGPLRPANARPSALPPPPGAAGEEDS